MGNNQERIAKLKLEIERLEEQDLAEEALSKNKRLANLLHYKKCNRDHNEDCGWYYEEAASYPGGTWNGYTHKRYLDKADRLLSKMPNTPIEELLDLVDLLG